MEMTLTPEGIRCLAQQLAEMAVHAAYTLDGKPLVIPVFRKLVEGAVVKIYVYFDETIAGEVANVELVDTAGNVMARNGRKFVKTNGKGLYVAFRYRVKEQEEDDG